MTKKSRINQYLTYEEYKKAGGKLDFSAFKQNIQYVCEFIDLHTQGRLQGVSEITPSVKACARDCAEYLADNYAVRDADEIKAEMLSIVYDHLINEKDDNGTPLMYIGYKS